MKTLIGRRPESHDGTLDAMDTVGGWWPNEGAVLREHMPRLHVCVWAIGAANVA